MNVIFRKEGTVRAVWWVILFFGLLALVTVPIILLSHACGFEITLAHQAIIIVFVNAICQLIRKRSFVDMIGKPDLYFLETFLTGLLVGAALMIVPAMIMYLGGWVTWNAVANENNVLLSAAFMIMMGVIAEEFLFRGFVFQILLEHHGRWVAQLIMSSLFLLTHLNNPGMAGMTQVLASINIILASLLFGVAYIKTKSLAMPIGIHFMANLTQGTLLGFNVSGQKAARLFVPVFNESPAWLTVGTHPAKAV